MSSRTFNPTFVDAVSTETLGQRNVDHRGHEFMYVRASSALPVGSAVRIDDDFDAELMTTARATAGARVGVVGTALPSGNYGWVSIYGDGPLLVRASCAADVALYTSGVSGSLDDASSSQVQIRGIHLTASREASDGAENASWSYPGV